MRFALLTLVAVGVVGCGTSFNPYLPDGGRAQINCNATPMSQVPVLVLDPTGAKAANVTVSIINKGTNTQFNKITSEQGTVVVLDSEMGPGQTTVTAQLNDLKSQEGVVNFACGECSCAATPSSLTLNLK